METEKIKRKIEFYGLQFIGTDNTVTTYETTVEICKKAIELSTEKSRQRFLQRGQGVMVSILDMTFDGEAKQISGKIIRTRTDLFPNIHDMNDDRMRDIEAEDSEGIAEITHFVIDYSQGSTLAIEYNFHGPKARDLQFYFDHISRLLSLRVHTNMQHIVRDASYNIRQRIGRISYFEAKVHKDNISRINEVDPGLASAFEVAHEYAHSEYVKISFKTEYRKKLNNEHLLGKISQIINKFVGNGNLKKHFDVLSVGAEDSDHENKLQLFDLLADKITIEVMVEKMPKKRSIVSESIFEYLRRYVVQYI